MANFATNASGAIWSNLESMQVPFFLLAEEITQVKGAIPWVRCASGNVLLKCFNMIFSGRTRPIQQHLEAEEMAETASSIN